jgi:hypothetical protein
LRCLSNVFLTISYAFSSTKLKNKKAKQVLPGSRRWGRGPKQCKNDKVKERNERASATDNGINV